MPSSIKKAIAKFGEDLAANYLSNKGYVVLERNWHSGRFGEIDIIVQNKDPNKNNLIVFVEVKTRKLDRCNKYSSAWLGLESINFHKKRKILITANSYLAKHKKVAAQFDVILVEYDSESIQNSIVTHIENAFGI